MNYTNNELNLEKLSLKVKLNLFQNNHFKQNQTT